MHVLVEQEGYIVWRGASTEWNGPQERQCPDVEVQYLRKWGYPDEEEQGALWWCTVDVPT